MPGHRSQVPTASGADDRQHSGAGEKQFVFVFLGLLVARRKFSTISLSFLMVGHTHEHIDQLFALFVEMVWRRHRFQSPQELAEAIDKEIGPVVCEKR